MTTPKTNHYKKPMQLAGPPPTTWTCSSKAPPVSAHTQVSEMHILAIVCLMMSLCHTPGRIADTGAEYIKVYPRCQGYSIIRQHDATPECNNINGKCTAYFNVGFEPCTGGGRGRGMGHSGDCRLSWVPVVLPVVFFCVLFRLAYLLRFLFPSASFPLVFLSPFPLLFLLGLVVLLLSSASLLFLLPSPFPSLS
jgi:hypothetical protein